MLITDKRLEQALTKIALSDATVAELHAGVERAESYAKAAKDAVFLRSEGSVADRQAIAGTHEDYALAMESYFVALQAYEKLRNERQREYLIADLWRSMSSARTKGVVI